MEKLGNKINNWINSFEKYDENRRMITYFAMRRTIGILGISLPFILIIGSALFYCCYNIMPSVSQYYHTSMRDVFVGILFFTSIFLFAYRGHNVLDRIAGIIAGISALGIALFPTNLLHDIPGCTLKCFDPSDWKNAVHFTSATVFFLVLALTSIFLFTQTWDKAKEENKKLKKNRNRVYRVCGVLMILSMILVALYKFWLQHKFPGLKTLNIIFWLEAVMLASYGISWLVKGQIFLKDIVKD